MTRTAFAGAMRAAAVTLLEEYATFAGTALQVYPGRPRTLYPPTAFVDRLPERIAFYGPTMMSRTPIAEIVVIHGLYDAKDTVTQRDAFVDGFLDWCADRFHAAGANTLIGGVSVEDEPGYVPEWIPPGPDGTRKTYYATVISLEGLVTD